MCRDSEHWKRDSLRYFFQVDIFRAVSAWSKANSSLDVQPILAEIRLSLFTINDLLKVTMMVKNGVRRPEFDGK